jgi:hypothetical protein
LVRQDGGGLSDDEPLSFLAKADQSPVAEVIGGETEEISPSEEPPLEKLEKRESEPRVFRFDDVPGEVSVFDEIAMSQVSEDLCVEDTYSRRHLSWAARVRNFNYVYYFLEGTLMEVAS